MELASQRTNRTERRIRFVFALTCIVLLSWMMKRTLNSGNQIISPIPDTPQPTAMPHNMLSIFTKKKSSDDLEKKINDTIDDAWSNYSVMIEDYTSDFSVRISDTEIFTAASVNKIPILAALYYYAQKGDIDLDKVITVQPQDIQDYGTGSIRYDKPGSTYSLKTLAKLMMQQSDNTAAYILANHIITFDKLTAIVNQWGMSQTDMVTNKTSNNDIALLMRKIYEEKITNHAQTLEMLSFMKDTDFESRLPDKLPDTVTVYHKIGTEVRTIHDAGIVTNGKQTYYIGIFTTDVDDDPSTEERMAKISKVVYEYML